MKPYRNIYVASVYDESFFTGELEIPYIGELTYGVNEEPEGFDQNQDVYFRCTCDLKEFKCFKKV